MDVIKFIAIGVWFALEVLYYKYGNLDNANWWLTMSSRSYFLVGLCGLDGYLMSNHAIIKYGSLFLCFIMILFLAIEFTYINASIEEYTKGIESRIFSRMSILIYVIIMLITTYTVWVKRLFQD